MVVGTTIRIDSSEVIRKLRRLSKAINTRQLLEAIGDRHLRWVNLNFRKAGAEAPHKPMSINTIFLRPKRSSRSHFSSRYRSRLEQSFNKKIFGDRQVVVGTEDAFAPIHHFGAGPYTIVGKGSNLLSFRTARGFVRTRSVRHPAIPSRHLLPSQKVGADLALKVVNAAVNKAARKCNHG